MRNSDINTNIIEARNMTLDQSRRVLQETRHLVGKLWEDKTNDLWALFCKFWDIATKSDKENILQMVSVDKNAFRSCIMHKRLLAPMNGNESFTSFLKAFLSLPRGEQNNGTLGGLNLFMTAKREDGANFRELAEEIILLSNLDQANEKLGNLAKTAEHMARNFS